jgi:hypothetical protein
MVSVGRCDLLGDGLFVALVARSFEPLAVELVEADAVGLVRDQEIEHGPDECEAAPATSRQRRARAPDAQAPQGGTELADQ